ncbi:MBL fold metallo-hydrolase [Rossellomorea vietnamensis]|uniref:MBL fold metallo-hydrolase n=1 Tax=Rossellomorea vietnamensis TaxID=218284 RepID=A0A6I6UCN8_9BACI|nr:MBL fold metallo-hydrolase [Rossellomorea vietnamensis]QHE60484.1 MBL fold metallo-hydrolase [Rossellomorea vietnamensis]
MKPLDSDFSDSHLPFYSVNSGKGKEVCNDLFYWTNQIGNVCFYGTPGSREWVLIDCGMPHAKEKIMEAAEERFGHDGKPQAIVLTHGHFDHVGSLEPLLEEWDVPVYAHELEIPYLNGKKDYPKGNPKADGGLVSEFSPLYPHHGIDVSDRLHVLPANGEVPFMPGWTWVHTPGHTPGHVSLFREGDRTLIAGDAFVTVKQESLYKVVFQKKEISGPPKYFTMDWKAARKSVETLYNLNPASAVTGHGDVMDGKELEDSLRDLLEHFDAVALPADQKAH